MGEGILVIGAIAHMIINKYIRFYRVEYLVKSKGVSCISLDEVPVKVVISGVASKSIAFWTILIGSCGGIPV